MGRTVIAIRVSPRPAENVRYSPEMQESECREWCRDNGHEVVGVVSDILVSGGSRKRFESILRAIDELRPDLFVVADLSRWTRDTPARYYAMRAILDDAGIRLASVAEPIVGSDMPFSDTITTAIVESNLQQRLVLNAKTSAGMRRAWAAGKRFGGGFGWTREDGGWVRDEGAIRALYEDWLSGVPISEMARRHGLGIGSVSRAVRAKRQIDVVGIETWQRAQDARRGRSQRNDAKWGNVWRGLLVCPFCGRTLQQAGWYWGTYVCMNRYRKDHGWFSLSARKWVLPEVAKVIGRLHPPSYGAAPRSEPRKAQDPKRELDRLSMAWAKGRLSDERYERAMADVEARMREAAEPEPPSPTIVEDVRAIIPYLDCHIQYKPHRCTHRQGCPRGREGGGAVNDVLRELIEHILVDDRMHAEVVVRPQYRAWLD